MRRSRRTNAKCARSRSSSRARTVCTPAPSFIHSRTAGILLIGVSFFFFFFIRQTGAGLAACCGEARGGGARCGTGRDAARAHRGERRAAARGDSGGSTRVTARGQRRVGARAGAAARPARGDQPRADGKRESAPAAARAWEAIAIAGRVGGRGARSVGVRSDCLFFFLFFWQLGDAARAVLFSCLASHSCLHLMHCFSSIVFYVDKLNTNYLTIQ